MHTLSTERPALANSQASSTAPALRFITCGSVDDGKSTLIGRLLLDSRSVLQDQLAHVTHQASGQINAAELARLTDGLQAEREQGITIDVAWRYFATPQRKFIIGDAPGHEQYTRNMVTAASQADCAVVLVDATKLAWAASGEGAHTLLPQTRRHALLAQLLRVPHIVFAINKLDAVADASAAYQRIHAALQAFASEAGLDVRATIPVSALTGWNVVDPHHGWCDYQGPALLELLEQLPREPHAAALPAALPVQWVESNASSTATDRSRRVLWGRVSEGTLRPGDTLQAFPSGQSAQIVELLDHGRRPLAQAQAPASTGVVLDRELDISRGDWLLGQGAPRPRRDITATIAWLDQEPLQPGRVYWALHGHRWVKAKVTRIVHQLDITTLQTQEAESLAANAIGQVQLALQTALPVQAYADSRSQGAMILVDTASHATAAALLIEPEVEEDF